MDKLTKKGLDGTQLKTIALVLMVLDHIHYFFEFTGCIPTVFSMLGRLSAPLFLFCTVEGFAHTHDRKRYFIRIWVIGTAMAALEFFMIYAKAFRRGDGFYPQNAIFQDLALLCIVWQGIDWLRETCDDMGLSRVTCVHARAEEFAGEHRQAYDMATSRAVAALPLLSELALPLVKVGGCFLAMKSVDSDAEIDSARGAIGQLGGKIEAIRDYTIPGTDVTHRVVIIRKVKDTPPQFPRSWARMKKAPLK